jgi:pyruvate, orthophosphate dikinase
VVAGIRTPQPIAELEKVLPKAYKQLRDITSRLEKHYRDIQDFEFTIQDERLFMLQTRSGKRTGYAAVVIATDMVREKLITPKEAVLLVDPESLSQLLAPGFDPKEWARLPVVTKGLPASPGAASGHAVFTADDAVEWADQGKPGDPRAARDRARRHPRHVGGAGHPHGDRRHDVARRGRRPPDGQAVGRGRRRARDQRAAEDVHRRRQTVKEGDFVSFDGLTGEVKLEKLGSHPSEILQVLSGAITPADSDIYRRFMQLLNWSDRFRRMGVRANADLPDQAELAYAFGARGIGLCRTEHMFFGEGRIPIVQRMILADNEADRRAALNELLPLQRDDFYGVFKAMKGEPVTIRTIDPPLHEFLPKREDLMVEIARLEATGQTGRELDGEEDAAGPGRAAPRVQPDARPPRRAARDHVSGDHRDADARHHRGRLPQLHKEGLKVVPEIMIPARGAREGAARSEGGGGPRGAQEVMKEQGVHRSSTSWAR